MYIDGSAQFPAEPFLRRCGYSVVSLDDRLDCSVHHPAAISLAVCAVCGPLKRHLHTVPASETMAFCVMLILHCRMATIARLWVTLGKEEVEMARGKIAARSVAEDLGRARSAALERAV